MPSVVLIPTPAYSANTSSASASWRGKPCRRFSSVSFAHKARNRAALQMVDPVLQAEAPQLQPRRQGVRALAVLIFDGTLGNAAVPLLDQALDNEAGQTAGSDTAPGS